MENMHDHIADVQQNPEPMVIPFNLPEPLGFRPKLLHNVIADCFYLAGRTAARNNKKIGDIGNLTHIQDNGIERVFVFSGTSNG
jgi:hypothetical protein